MRTRTPSESQFLRETKDHELIVLADDGQNRHLTFKQPSTSNRYFNITTWPGYLCISGDMGCYVFSRLADMFEFFRGEGINLSYWAEKLQAHDRGGGHREFSEELFRHHIVSDFRAAYPQGKERRLEHWAELREMLEWETPYSTESAITAAMTWRDAAGEQPFSDFYEHRLEDYTHHFVWCCHAIRWAVEQYDEYKASQRFPALTVLHAQPRKIAEAA
ncbi:hypothetical protein [Devosia sp. MC521]|uniref:hypothetical protein n=1 Tax=Devosia sp. MC521 TaxID=2759954 RepID=UPI0015F8CA6C|nr:hypothetical protein [Devosia sp. MC521]MBJ6986901.1 hypothetical protein [Devosia sp. MC521]QMW63927.1 hypothetical protein H4N61_06315 [Devosia sp. MC521]